MHILTILGGAGALQGAVILLSILLRFRHRKNLPLVLLLFAFSIRLATIPTWSEHCLLRFPWILPFTASLPALFGPLLLWYVREVMHIKHRHGPVLILHGIPYVCIFGLLSCKTFCIPDTKFAEFVGSVFSGHPPRWFTLQNWVKVVLNVVYTGFAARIAFGKQSREFSRQKRFWVRCIVLAPAIVLSLYCYVALNPAVTAQAASGYMIPFKILAITMLTFVYVIGFLFMFTPNFSMIDYSRSVGEGKPLCSDEECRSLMFMVEEKLDDDAITNPDLTISDLAALIPAHPNRISYTINHCTGMTFKTLLNKKRLDQFCRKAQEGFLNNHSILDLAYEAGFPSKSTFNRVFHEYTGMTPSEYLQKHGNC